MFASHRNRLSEAPYQALAAIERHLSYKDTALATSRRSAAREACKAIVGRHVLAAEPVIIDFLEAVDGVLRDDISTALRGDALCTVGMAKSLLSMSLGGGAVRTHATARRLRGITVGRLTGVFLRAATTDAVLSAELRCRYLNSDTVAERVMKAIDEVLTEAALRHTTART